MKKKRFALKLTSVLMAAVMLLFCAPVLELSGLDIGLTKASAISTTKSGTFAKTLKWSFNTLTQKLTISGTGAIPDYNYEFTDNFEIQVNTPWKKYNPLSLEIKSGVTKIGNYAFANCSLLTSISVADSVEYIGEGNFDNSIWMMNKKSGAIYIGKNLYCYSGSGTSVTLKDSTVSISPNAFVFSNVKSVTLSSSLKTIGSGAFWACETLKSIKMPKSLKTIEDYAFYGCTSLSSLSLNEGLKTIGDSAFYGCEKLKSVTIPSTVSSIGLSAFSDCTSLSKISVASSNKYFCTDKNGVLFDKKKTVLKQFPVASKLTSYSVPSSVTQIAYCAFAYAENLIKITLPSKLKVIEGMAFMGCGSLKTINFPSSIESADYIGIEDSNWYAVQPIGMIYIGKVAYTYKGNMNKNTKITLKNGTTSIAEMAFSDCENLVSITIPSGVKSIGAEAFCYCINLKSITLPSTVSTIGEGAFSECSALTSIVIPAKVKKIEAGTFSECEKLKSVKILNPLCTVASNSDSDSNFGLSWLLYEEVIPKSAKIISFKGSSAESYAKENGNTFEALNPISLKNCTVTKIADQKYTGKALTPAVTVKYKGATLKSGKHFTVTYSSNTKTGTAKVTLKGNSNYGFTGTVTTTFKITK